MKKLLRNTLIGVASLCASGMASSAAVDFIDNDYFTSDTISGLDWLDVTASLNQSYNYVSSQFGVGGKYEGWRYATGTEFTQLINNYTDADYPKGYVRQREGNIDGLVQLLGDTLNPSYMKKYGKTFVEVEGLPGDIFQTIGILADRPDPLRHYLAKISDNDIYPDSPDYSLPHSGSHTDNAFGDIMGHFLVRNTLSLEESKLSPVPVPAAAWLFGSALLGFAGFSRRRKNKA